MLGNYKMEDLKEDILKSITYEWITAEGITAIMNTTGKASRTVGGLLFALGNLEAEGKIESLSILTGDKDGDIAPFPVFRMAHKEGE